MRAAMRPPSQYSFLIDRMKRQTMVQIDVGKTILSCVQNMREGRERNQTPCTEQPRSVQDEHVLNDAHHEFWNRKIVVATFVEWHIDGLRIA